MRFLMYFKQQLLVKATITIWALHLQKTEILIVCCQNEISVKFHSDILYGKLVILTEISSGAISCSFERQQFKLLSVKRVSILLLKFEGYSSIIRY